VSIVVAFVNVDTFTVLFLVAVGADAVAGLLVAFSDKSRFAVAVEASVGVFAYFGGGVAGVCSFVAFVDVFALSVFVFVSLGADAIAIFLNKAGLAVAIKVAVSVFAVL
jgi:hypothetical protein